MKKRTIGLLMALVLGVGLTGGAVAASNNQTISALLNRNIKITYNGQVQTFKDANGATVYPISYNGTTYLPVRAVSGLVGLPVNWDGPNNTVVLGTSEAQPVNLVSQKNSGTTQYNYIINDASLLKFSGSDAIMEYKNGIVWSQWNGTMSSSKERLCFFDTTGYTSVSFTVASDVRGQVKVYDQDYKVITTFENQQGQIQSKTIALNGATKIAFCSDYPNFIDVNVKDEGNVFIYEPTLS